MTGERTTEDGDETNNAQRDRCEIIARKGTGAENCAGASLSYRMSTGHPAGQVIMLVE
jgi:hypothetical protein